MSEIQSIGALAAQFGGVAGIAGFIYLLYSTKSLHPLRHILWRVIYGQEVPADPKVAGYAARQISLMNFRHFAGIDAESLDQAHQYIDWANDLQLPLRKISLARKYVDVPSMSIREDLVTTFKRWPWLASLCFSYTGFVLAIAATLSPAGLYRVKATDTYFAVTPSSVIVWNKGLWPQFDDHSPCSMGAHAASWSKPDRDAICDLINSDRFAEKLAEGIRDFRVVTVTLIMYFGWLFVVGALNLRSHRAALDVLDRSPSVGCGGVVDTQGQSRVNADGLCEVTGDAPAVTARTRQCAAFLGESRSRQ